MSAEEHELLYRREDRKYIFQTEQMADEVTNLAEDFYENKSFETLRLLSIFPITMATKNKTLETESPYSIDGEEVEVERYNEDAEHLLEEAARSYSLAEELEEAREILSERVEP